MLIDNKVDRYKDDGFDIVTVWDFINEFAGKDSQQTGKLDIVTGYFTIRALSKLYQQIPEEDEFRLVSSEMVKAEDDDAHVIDLLNGAMDIDSTLSLDQDAKNARAFLERNNVYVKAIVDAFCHAKAYMFKNDIQRNDSFYLTGSSNLTDAGLGLKKSSNVELSIGDPCKQNNPEYQAVCSWFEDIWKHATDKIPSDPQNPKSEKISVKDYFIKQIEDYFRKYTPEEIYYKILFELFNADIDLESGIEHKQDMSLLQTSAIWNTLFNYQQKGVISLIKMLRKYNGAILADAVGLGKTFSALAVIKFFQTQGYTTVLFCPKKLEQNWIQYQRRHGSQFDRDEFDYLVRFHTDLQNNRLQDAYNEAPLEYLQGRKKLLIVIDESHNLRNEKSGRYQELIDSLIRKRDENDNRDVKVLMLSATPINTGLADVKGQFNLIGRGADDAFKGEEFEVESLKNLFTAGQKQYNKWCEDEERTIGGFISKLSPKFFNLTDKLIVARTRQMIEKTLSEDLHFPKKDKPENIYQGVDHFGKYRSTQEIYVAFEKLNLTAYQPSKYIPEHIANAKKEAKSDWQDDFFREQFLVKMMGILFLKRLESSWYALLLTVKKVLDIHESTLAKVVAFKGEKNSASVDIDFEVDDEQTEAFALQRKSGPIRLSEMKNLNGFEQGLRHDINMLNEIYESLLAFEEDYHKGMEYDQKLDKLQELLENKSNLDNKKVVIFTAYADTAKFIYEELKKRGITKMAMVSGQEILTTGHQSTTNYNEILQCFAPYSKLYKEKDWTLLYEKANLSRLEYYDDNKHRWEVPYEIWLEQLKTQNHSALRLINDEIDVLIATDCLSEGQNLQDADMQVNYDIHWNPVRLIQRFGRIDRIGSRNEKIKCVNFWPAKSFEEYLNLEDRIMSRMAIMNLAGSETQDLNEKFEEMVKDNVLQDKNADRLLKELTENSITDIESQKTLSLKDFSFEVYRQDLIDYFEQHKEIFRKMPNGIFSGFSVLPNLFEQVPESLIAVVGYPHREPGSKKAYKNIYLMCQPAVENLPASYVEINQAEILEFLRQNKYADRFVPNWIEDNDTEKLGRLTSILKDWMVKMAPQENKIELKGRFRSNGTATQKKSADEESLDKKFQLENFDLIVWEYITRQ